MSKSKDYIKTMHPLRVRFLSAWKVLFAKQFILVRLVKSPNKSGALDVRYGCRTNLNTEQEVYILNSVIESLNKNYEKQSRARK